MAVLSLLGAFLLILFIGPHLRKVVTTIKSPLRKIPGPWYSALTSGHLAYLFSTGTIWKFVEKKHAKYGTIVRLGPRQVWVSDKDAIRQILVGLDLPKVAMYAEISRDKLAPGLFGEIRPDPHKRLKRFLSPAFTVSYVDKLEVFFGSTIRNLLDKYESTIACAPLSARQNGFHVDFMEDLHNVALDIMGECSFGKGFGQTNAAQGIDLSVSETIWRSIPRAIFDGLRKRYRTVYVKKILRAIGIHREFDWPPEMITAIDAVVQNRRLSSDAARHDLLQHLTNEGRKADTGERMGTREIIDQMAEILLAGSETTSGTIACFFMEMARNPDVRRKLFASLPARSISSEIIGGKAVRTEPEYEYLEACIKENLRLHPIASEMGRRTGDQWVNLMGYDLPPHTVISASYRHLHRNEQFWPQANRFWPERWLADDKRGSAPAADTTAYYPFSGGKHSCIGINFAWAEMRMIAANILSRFDVVEVPGQEVDFRQYITMQFATGHWKVVLIPRYCDYSR